MVGCMANVVVLQLTLRYEKIDLTGLMRVGEESHARPQIERELGTLSLAYGLGHDGKYFYLIARQPWVWAADAETLIGIEDPGYRYARPLYPLIAGLGGTLPPRATFYGLIVVQVLAHGLYALVIAGIARRHRLSTFIVLLGLANPGCYIAAIHLTSDLLATTLVLAGLWAFLERRTTLGLVLFAASCLAKEYFCLTPLALAAPLFLQRQWRSGSFLVVIPVIPLIAWKVMLITQVGLGGGSLNFDWPTMGIVRAANTVWFEPAKPIVAVVYLVVGVGAALFGFGRLARWQCAAWGVLGLTASNLVWGDPYDLLRVLTPLGWFMLWAWYPKSESASIV